MATFGFIEHDCNGVRAESANDLAQELAEQARAAWRLAMYEARERKYWMERDLCTC